MRFVSLLTAAFVADPRHNKGTLDTWPRLKMTTKQEAEECFTLQVRRRLLERSINNEPYLPLTTPNLQPGDVVKQKSVLLDPDTNEPIGTCYTLANVLDEQVRLAHGAYNITSGERTGLINFSALISNSVVTDEFDVAITSGTHQFHSAQGYIVLSPWTGEDGSNGGFLERDATFRICGLYE